jgi:hypothetical protein
MPFSISYVEINLSRTLISKHINLYHSQIEFQDGGVTINKYM